MPFRRRWSQRFRLIVIATLEAPLNRAFITTPLTPAQWVICFAMGSAVLWSSELRKVFLRATDRSQTRSTPSGYHKSWP
ncbi:hypothetical protein PFAS1_21930 [Pseudomonas frederiksbergensis]|nr:hypothetical protein PFAS1_21930 [Pseudomonas frederiksbergensis]